MVKFMQHKLGHLIVYTLVWIFGLIRFFQSFVNRNPALSTVGGILGLVLAMLVETLLFIIKTSKDDQIQSSKSSSSSFTPTTKKNQ
ncbi:unnamed protein product [Thlaspi arvense]|uniref:Uncharacterized protein n=1 Tax=Thlaspi arvense TaxID=13288 RepID=A0AAU9STA0_THLAR|nr:unnamed protein product [Thlaspi arvense]